MLHDKGLIPPYSPAENQKIDWNTVFLVTSKLMAIVAIVYLSYRYWLMFELFGMPSISMIGQFLIGCFFTAVVMGSKNGMTILTAGVGMLLLTGMF